VPVVDFDAFCMYVFVYVYVPCVCVCVYVFFVGFNMVCRFFFVYFHTDSPEVPALAPYVPAIVVQGCLICAFLGEKNWVLSSGSLYWCLANFWLKTIWFLFLFYILRYSDMDFEDSVAGHGKKNFRCRIPKKSENWFEV